MESIGRVNFLHEKGFAFNYRMMLVAVGVFLFVLASIAGLQLGRVYYYKKTFERDQRLIVELEKEKEKRLAMVEIIGSKQIGAGEYKDLYAVFQRNAPWSLVLGEIAKLIPPGLWLTSMESDSGKAEAVVLSLKGEARTSKAISFFLMRLQESSILNDAQLLNSQKKDSPDDGFEFLITMKVSSNKR